MLTPNLCKVFACHALKLLGKLPTESIDAVIADPMYMVKKKKGRNCIYDWGVEPGTGKPEEFWTLHQPICEECRRVLKPGGRLAWAISGKFKPHFLNWFGGHRIWGMSRYFLLHRSRMNHVWMVQTREQTPIRFPDTDGLVIIGPRGWWRHYHPCPKSEEEMRFMVRHLTEPGQIVLDCFAGSGFTFVSAEQLRRLWIGCDVSPKYCLVAMKRLADLRANNSVQPSLAAG